MKTHYISLLLAGILLVSGCFTNIPLTHYYTFQPAGEKAVQKDTSKYPYVIGVEEFEANVPYKQDKIVFRTSAYEVNFYEYHKWLRPPTELLQEQAVELLISSALFQKVHTYVFESFADYSLHGRIVMFDQWYGKDTAASVHVGITYQLISHEQQRIVWSDTITVTTPISSLGVIETVKAFESALYDNILQAIAAIDQVLSQE
jgi:ABC-type uncharacterized transport system auxiliary subunit